MGAKRAQPVATGGNDFGATPEVTGRVPSLPLEGLPVNG